MYISTLFSRYPYKRNFMKRKLFYGAFCVLISLLFSESKGQISPTAEVQIPLRDGQSLAADIYVPTSCTSCPVILIQTPYNKNQFRQGLPLGYGGNVNASPYAWVITDWRGFYGSAQAAVANPSRGEDGYDVMDWIVNQAWCNGKIGTWGPSALGVIQYQTAREQHPAHTCAVPLVAHPHTSYDSYFYGGVLEKARLQSLDALGYGLSPTILANVYFSPTWQFAANQSWYPSAITIPTLQIGGWYDHNIDKMISWYEACRNQAALNVRNQQWLLVGPWVHGGTGAAYVGSAQQGELSYPDAAFKSDSMARAFLAHYLLQQSNGFEQTPLIWCYDLGKQGWVNPSIPLPEALQTSLFFQANEKLDQSSSQGFSVWTSDPTSPTPTLGGQTLAANLIQGPVNQSSLQQRSDLLWFETTPFVQDFTIMGRTNIRVYITSTRPDADVVIRLIDVYPDGRQMLLHDGVRRLRFRNGYAQNNEAFLSPSDVAELDISLPFIRYTWKAGHRLGVYVAGNSAPRWDVNLQNGGTMYTSGDSLTAQLSLLHSAQYPSSIQLPGTGLLLQQEDLHESKPLIYPNPASIYLSIPALDPGMQVSIFDVNGRICGTYEVDFAKKIKPEHLPSGAYWLQTPLGKMSFQWRQ